MWLSRDCPNDTAKMSRKIGALVEYALPCQSGDQIDELSEKMRKTISVHCPFILETTSF